MSLKRDKTQQNDPPDDAARFPQSGTGANRHFRVFLSIFRGVIIKQLHHDGTSHVASIFRKFRSSEVFLGS